MASQARCADPALQLRLISRKAAGAQETASFTAFSALEYFLLLARDLALVPGESYEKVNEQIVELQRMLGSLIRKVEAARAGEKLVS